MHPNFLIADSVLVAGIAGASAVLVSIVPLLVVIWRGHHKVAAEVRTIHILVNSQKTEAARYTALLLAALDAAGLDIPDVPKPSEEVDNAD